jgi:hypothetical protein
MSTASSPVRRAVAPAVAGCLGLLVLAAAPHASASPPRSEQVPVVGSPYATPLPTLGGLTLAQYLAQHQAGDRRLR